MKWPRDQIAIRATFEAMGFVVLKSLFDAHRISEIRAHLDRYVAYVAPRVPAMDVFYEDVNTKQQVRMLSRMDTHDGYFHGLLTDDVLLGIAQYLWNCPASPRDIAFFNKPALVGEATPPHQDGFYFHLDPCEAVTMWLALDEVDEHNGCIRYVAGSHRRGMRPHGRTRVLGFSQGIGDYGEETDLSNEVPVCVSPGDVIIHDALTIHRADANSSPRSRRALGFVYFSSRARVDTEARDRYQQKLAHDLSLEGKI